MSLIIVRNDNTINTFILLQFFLCIVAAVALAREYPAGLHPAVCPNYPYCDTNTFARFTPDGMPIPEWVYNPSILPVAPVE